MNTTKTKKDNRKPPKRVQQLLFSRSGNYVKGDLDLTHWYWENRVFNNIPHFLDYISFEGSDNESHQMKDMHEGVDYRVIDRSGKVWDVGFRCQAEYHPTDYGTVTVRKDRTTGTMTEIDKTRSDLLVQAYMDPWREGRPLGIYITATDWFFDTVKEAKRQNRYVGNATMRPNSFSWAGEKLNQHDNTRFIWVCEKGLSANGYGMYTRRFEQQ